CDSSLDIFDFIIVTFWFIITNQGVTPNLPDPKPALYETCHCMKICVKYKYPFSAALVICGN
ncbi:MAG: hypothetical protein AABZ54_03965, partial [Bacteroidota bacterium]